MHAQRKLLIAGFAILAATTAFAVKSLAAQGDKPLAFEVASIRVHPVISGGFLRRGGSLANLACPPHNCGITGNRYVSEGSSLLDLLMDAYKLKRYQVTGLPSWGDSGHDVYDLAARVEGATPTVEQVRQMLQTLLAERFQLKMHIEQREMPVYALVLGKNGSKLKPIPQEEGKPPVTNCSAIKGVRAARDVDPERVRPWESSLEGLSMFSDRPVIDKTGYSGYYCTSDGQVPMSAVMPHIVAAAGGASRGTRGGVDPGEPDRTGPSMFTIIQEKWGMKLESQKAPIDILVVDRVERPSAN